MTSRAHLALGVSLISLLAVSSVAAQDAAPETQVDDVVVTAPNYVSTVGQSATKSTAPLIETPQSVSVISRDQIELLGWTNLMQAVRYTAGITSENYGPDERYDWLTLRGFNPIQYIDGLQAPFGSVTNIGTDLYGFESVEVLKGPSSGLYGSTPPGGIVNLTSRRPQDVFSGEIGGLVGNRSEYQISGDVTGPITDTIDGRVTALYRQRDTQLTGVESERTYVAPALSFEIGPRTDLTLLGYYQDDLVTGDGGGFLPAFGVVLPNPLGTVSTSTNLGEPDFSRFEREQSGFGYDLRHQLSDSVSLTQNLKVFSNAAFQTGPYGTGLLDANGDGTPDDFRTVTRSQFAFAEDVDSVAVDTRLAARLSTGGLEHSITAGLDYRTIDNAQGSFFGNAPSIDLFAPVYGATIESGPVFTFLNQTQDQTGLYVQDQIRAGRFVVTLAGRQDWVETEDNIGDQGGEVDQFTGRVGVNYVLDNGIAPYVSWSTSFQPVGGATFEGELFVPTEGEQVEAGIKYDGRNLPDGIDVFASAAVYALTQKNVLTPDPLPGRPFASVQTGEVEVKGLEIEATARFYERLSLNVSYGYTDSEVTASTDRAVLGRQLTVTPEHKASVLADYTIQTGALAGLGAGVGVRYMGPSFGDGANQWETPSSTLWDAVVHYDFGDWRVQATASNLFDQTYLSRCSSSVQCFYGSRGLYALSLTRSF